MIVRKLRDRWRCHGSTLCCQYVDTPLCNGSLDPHRITRRYRLWREQRDERRWHQKDVPSEIVAFDFKMDPKTDELIYGQELKDGMVVLLDGVLRANPDWVQNTAADRARLLQTARWCKIESLRTWGDKIMFHGVYADGSKFERTYNESFSWFVKKASF